MQYLSMACHVMTQLRGPRTQAGVPAENISSEVAGVSSTEANRAMSGRRDGDSLFSKHRSASENSTQRRLPGRKGPSAHY